MKKKFRIMASLVMSLLMVVSLFNFSVLADDETQKNQEDIAQEDQEILSEDNSVAENEFETALVSGNVDVEDDYDVAYTGDFSKVVSGYIVVYPEKLTQSDKKWPVIAWANGTACAPVLYWNALCALASKGYIVVASSDTMSANGKSQIGEVDYIISENEDSESDFYNKVDTDKIGVAGHSQGGRSTVNAAKSDSRIKAAVSIAGSNTSGERSGLTTPTLFLTGTADLVVYSSLWVKPTYNKAEGPAAYASLKGGIHTSVITNYDRIVYYTAKWMDAYLNDNDDSRKIFMEGGELFTDSSWKDVKSKSVELAQTGSIFGNGNLLIGIGIVAILVGFGFAIVGKKKKIKEN
jgi:LPXTG-motif cell wall-anchored protein